MRDITQKLLDLAKTLDALSNPAEYPRIIEVQAGPCPGWVVLMLRVIVAIQPVAKWLELHEPAATEERFRAKFGHIEADIHKAIQSSATEPDKECQRLIDEVAQEARLLAVYCRGQIRSLGDCWAVTEGTTAAPPIADSSDTPDLSNLRPARDAAKPSIICNRTASPEVTREMLETARDLALEAVSAVDGGRRSFKLLWDATVTAHQNDSTLTKDHLAAYIEEHLKRHRKILDLSSGLHEALTPAVISAIEVAASDHLEIKQFFGVAQTTRHGSINMILNDFANTVMGFGPGKHLLGGIWSRAEILNPNRSIEECLSFYTSLISLIWSFPRIDGEWQLRAEIRAECARATAMLFRVKGTGLSTGADAAAEDHDNCVAQQADKPVSTKKWIPPEGYVGANTICNDLRFQKNGKSIPRTTLQVWAERDKPDCVLAPDNGECHYRETWVLECMAKWNPRKRKQ